MSRDSIFVLPQSRIGDFAFDEQVVEVFPDMISRSVPGYASILAMIEQLSARFATPGTNIYDLGCSLGAASRLISPQVPRDCTVYAIDSSAAMIDKLLLLLEQQSVNPTGCRIIAKQADVREVAMTNASFVVLNLTLQFVPLPDRPQLLQQIYQSLVSGGALLVSEKICFEDPYQQQLLTELHHDFKRAHGYSELEIAQKRASIENVLVPETLSTHCQRLMEVGFQQVVPWFQCFNFASILAVKN